jgi:CAI-1 autoinducer synthase
MQTIEQNQTTSTAAHRPDPAVSNHLAQRIQSEFTNRWDTLWSGRSLLHGRNPTSNAVRLNGNDYLSLTGHPDIVRAQTDAIKHDANFVIQSSVFLHGEHPVRDLERGLAQWLGKEDGLICQSGYTANLGGRVRALPRHQHMHSAITTQRT